MALNDPNRPLRRFWKLLATERKDIGNIYIYALFNGLLSLSIPLGIQAIINLIQSGTTSTAWVVLVIVVLVTDLMAMFMYHTYHTKLKREKFLLKLNLV